MSPPPYFFILLALCVGALCLKGLSYVGIISESAVRFTLGVCTISFIVVVMALGIAPLFVRRKINRKEEREPKK